MPWPAFRNCWVVGIHYLLFTLEVVPPVIRSGFSCVYFQLARYNVLFKWR